LKKSIQNFIDRHHNFVLNFDSNNLTVKLSKKLNDIFKKNKIPLSEEQTNVIFGLIQNNIKEKDFSTALLNIGNNNKQKKIKKKEKDFEQKNNEHMNKKKPIFEIYSQKNNNKNDKDLLLRNNNDKEPNSNYYVNIEEANEVIENLDYSEIKNDIKLPDFYEPKKSKKYHIKQFEFDDFIKYGIRNINLEQL
jgi:hypothetical protein